MNLADAWQVEVAALLSNLGCVVLPKESGQRSKQAEVAQHLLCNIPRSGQRSPRSIGQMGESDGGSSVRLRRS